MNALVRIFTFFSRYTKRIGVCGNVGLIAGSIVGLALTLLDLMRGGVSLSPQDALYIALILGGFTWIINLFILCIFVKFTFKSVAIPSLFNCFFTSFATVYLTQYLNAYPLAWLIGIIVGILIGVILCRLSDWYEKITN